MERIIRELNKTGYRISCKEHVRKEFVFYDTQEGNLFKKGKRLLYFPDPDDLLLIQGDEELKHENYEKNLLQNEQLCRVKMPGGQQLTRIYPSGISTERREAGGQMPGEHRSVVKLPAKLLSGIDGDGKVNVYLPYVRCTIEVERLLIESPTRSMLTVDVEEWSFFHPRNGMSSSNHRYLTISSKIAQQDVSFLSTILKSLSKIESVDFDPLESGLSFLQTPLPGAPIPDSLRIGRDDGIFQVGCKILSQQAYKMWANTEGTLFDLHPEFLHDLRVATRRARFALKVFKPFFNPEYVIRLRAELSWIGKLLGNVRDIDVIVKHMREQYSWTEISPGAKNAVEEYLLSKRRLNYPPLAEACDSSRYEGIHEELKSAIPENKVDFNTPALRCAPTLIVKQLKNVEKLYKKARSGYEPSDLHTLRIAFKGLRYTCEFFSDLYENEMRAHIKSIVAFQDCLGLYQDSRIALNVLGDVIKLKKDWDQETCLSLGAMVQIQRDVMRSQLSYFHTLAGTFPHIARSIKHLTGRECR